MTKLTPDDFEAWKRRLLATCLLVAGKGEDGSRLHIGQDEMRQLYEEEIREARSLLKTLTKYGKLALLGPVEIQPELLSIVTKLNRTIVASRARLERPRKRPGPSAWPDPIAVEILRWIVLAKRQGYALGWLREFIRDGGEWGIWLQQQFAGPKRRRAKVPDLPFRLYALNTVSSQKTKWASDLQNTLLKGLTPKNEETGGSAKEIRARKRREAAAKEWLLGKLRTEGVEILRRTRVDA